ncbi:MAG: hypothetical protein KC777_00165 [Cyanobacteria bacterium HKST-UBA02]|nr:hypothetical protein [Cyanobacteria bacterium HKST-UBA02]
MSPRFKDKTRNLILIFLFRVIPIILFIVTLLLVLLSQGTKYLFGPS